MPDGKTPITNFNPNEFKVVGNNKKTVTDFNPNEFKVIGQAPPKLREGDTNIVVPKYTTPQELEIDRTLNFIQENSLRNMRDDEKDILKNMMKNPLTSKDELSDAIVTLQGKKAKQIDNSWITPDYYMKRDEKSGNYKPIALEQGEKIPVGYHAASIWGTKLSAKDDNAWQDIGKSLSNGVFALMGGVVDVAQMGVELATGSESETLRGGQNAIEGLKFEKDADLDRPVYNMEGITKFGDLLDKDRFDFSPQALWGTFNSVAESFTEYGLGVFTGGTAIKGAKALKYGYQGIDKALDLGKAGKLGALFTGSFFTNAGDALDRAHEAGLTGRDAPAYAMLETTVKSSIDAAFGLEGKILSNAFKSTEKEIFKNIIKKVERDATTGLITPKGFKQLGKEMATEYSLLAKGAIKGKQVVKDMFEEGSNEVATTFAQKAGENLWDKMTDDERGQFGTDALSAKSFGEYANSFTQGFISGGMMSVPSQVLKNNHDNQSINTYERVKEGSEAVNALKTDLNNALEKGEITPSEHEQANFKIDAYNKYNEETKSVNLKPEDEKKAFELSFQIQGLKTEIPTNENEISKLDPITRAKVESKQKQAKELQSELNDIIRQGEIKGEPIVPKKEEERIQKEKEKEAKANEKETKVTPKPTEVKVPKIKVAKVKSDYTPIKSEEDKRTYAEVTPDEFNENKFPSRSRHRMLRKELSDVNKYPKGEVAGKLMPREYTYKGETKTTYKVKLPDGKEIRLSSSMMRPEGFRGHMRTERLKGNAEGMPVAVKVIDLNNPTGGPTEEGYKAGKKVLKIYDKVTGKFLSWAKETHQGSSEALDKEGKALYTPEQIELIKDLELVDETPADEVELTEIRKPILPVKQRAEEATKKIIEESKEKVKQSKNVSLTNEANKSKTVDTTNKNESEKVKNETKSNTLNSQKEFDKIANSDSKLKNIASILSKYGKGLNTRIINIALNSGGVTYTNLDEQGNVVTDVAIDLNNIKNVIENRKDKADFYEEVVLHEEVHRYTQILWDLKNALIDKSNWKKGLKESGLTDNEINFIAEVEELYNQYLKNKNNNVDFSQPNSDIKEFITYGLTNPEFIKHLDSIKINNSSILDRLINTLFKLFGENISVKIALEKSFEDFMANESIVKDSLMQIDYFKSKEKVKQSKQKENNTKSDGSSIRRKIVGYNRLSKEQKKSEFGVNLRNEIQKEAEDFGGSLKPLNKGKVQLLDSEGKQVKKASVKREQNVIDEEKALAKKTKDALNTVPTSLEQYIAMVVGRGGAFDKSVTKEIPDVPSLMKNNKGEGYSLESLYDGYKQESGLDNIDEKGFAIEVEGIIKPYLTSKGREAAIDYALEAYEKELNDGYTDKQIKELEAFAKENEIKESDVEKAKEIAQNVTVEEYKEITQKIESKNENERNEQLAEQIFEDYFGDENGINDVFIKDESKKSGEEKGISENEYPDDVFQKSKKMPLLNITNISSSNLALKENGINGRLLNEKQVSELQKEIEGNYVSEVSDLFNNKKDDLRQKAYNYDNPIAEKDSNGVNLRIAEGLIRDKKKTYLLYADGKIVGEFGSVQDAKNVVKYIEDNLINKNRIDLLQKESANKGKIDKVVALIKKALPKVNVVFDENLEASGKWSPSKNTITVNPLYAGLDTPIHEGGHILIDAMGYNNRIIQAAIKQLRDTDLYKETKKRYPELSDEELDKEVLAEAIGREGADIFDKVEDRSKFKAYLDYIFDWLKQKLGMDKNIAKSLAKQIIGGVKTKNLEGKAGKEQLQKESKKNPLGARPLKFEQYAAEHGFSYEKETEKLDEASYLLSEAQEEYDIAKENAEAATTDEEAAPLEEILSEKEIALNAAKKNFAIKGKRTFEYKKYKKDFNAIQKLMAEKELSDYTTEELQDLISMLHGFDNKAAKGVRNDAMIKLAMIATKKQQEKFKGMEGYIESLSKTKDISPLQTKILHHSHFSENNPDIQAASLAFGNAVMDKITDANTKKATHEKLATKVIAEENKKLGVVGASANRFSSDSAKYFNWMENEKGELLTIEEAKAKGLSEAKINYLKFTRETIADYKGTLEENDFENAVMDSIRIDKSFMEAYKSEGLLPAFSYYLGGGANNLGKVRFVHNGQIKSYAEVEKEILASADRKSITGMAKALWELLVANIQARRQLKKGFNVDEKENPLEVKGEAEYSLNEKGQLVSKFDKPRAKDRGYSKDFYKAMNQFIDESAHTKHISKIMPLVDSVEYLNKNGYTDEGYVVKPNVAKWIEDWKKLQIFKEPHVNDPVIDAAVKAMRNLVASTTMWFNVPANVMNVFMGNYNSFRQENASVLAKGNARLFGGKGKRGGEIAGLNTGIVNKYALEIIKKYSIVNQDFDSQPTIKAGSILSKMATFGTQVGEYQIQGSLGLGMLTDEEFNSFEYTKDKYGNEVLTVKPGVDEKALKERMTQIKNRVTDIQGKYPESDRRNILRGEFGKAAFQFKVWMPDYFKERFGAKYINAYGKEKEGTFTKLLRVGIKEMYADLKKGDFKAIAKNKAFMSNLKGVATIGTLIALSQGFEDDEDRKKKGGLSFNNALSQVLFILDLEQDKYMVSNPAAALGKIKDLLAAFEALVTLDEKAMDKVKRVIPANKITNAYELGKKIID